MIESLTLSHLFWVSLLLLVYTWFGYPVLLFLLERILYRPVRKKPIEPKLSVLILAHNEEERIERKIENTLALDYPAGLLEIVIASDGSYDRTAAIVRDYADKGVRLVEFPSRRGKPSVINDVVPTLSGEIVVLADVRQRLESDILRRLTSNFADDEVGGVSGELVFEDPAHSGVAAGIDKYWRYEKWIRTKESGMGSTVGGTGAIFALRKNCFVPLPVETILDDVVLPLQIVRHGKRVVYEKGARAWDQRHRDWHQEFERKTRTLSGNFQILFHLVQMGAGLRFLGLYGLQFFSHKVCRLLGPFCLIALFLSSGELMKGNADLQSFYAFFFYGQIAFYGTALAGAFLEGIVFRLPLVSLTYSFVIMQGAVLTGLLRYGSGRDDVLWEKAQTIDPKINQQRLLRLVADSTLFAFGFVVAFWVRYLGPPPDEVFNSYKVLFPQPWEQGLFGLPLAIPLVMLIPMAVFYFFRLNEIRLRDITPEYFFSLIKGIFYSTLILFFVIYIKRGTMLHTGTGQYIVSLPTSVLLIGFPINCLFIGGWRLAGLSIRNAARMQDDTGYDILLLGQPEAIGDIRAVCDSFSPKAHIVGSLDPEHLPPDTLWSSDQLRKSVSIIQPNVVTITPTRVPQDSILQAATIADEQQLPIQVLPGDLELLMARARPRLISYIPFLETFSVETTEVMNRCKQAADFFAGLLLCVFGTPFLLGLGAASFLLEGRSRSVKIRRRRRVGGNGRPLGILRLQNSSTWPRWWVHFAQRALDGFLLLSGRLSLVGPRALLPRSYKDLSPLAKRFVRCKPGLIHPPRLTICRNEALDSRSATLIYYTRNRSLALDLQILIQAMRPQRATPPADNGVPPQAP